MRSHLLHEDCARQYLQLRSQTVGLCEGLTAEDMTAQSMPDASPTKWHLGHTSWFFETLLLREHLPGYRAFDERFAYLFNSYYESAGPRHTRCDRGLLTRPTLEQVLSYREYVDTAVKELLQREPADASVNSIIEIGLHHEMQHQELILTDILHLFAHNPLYPAVQTPSTAGHSQMPSTSGFMGFEGGLVDVGANESNDRFSYDCERPRHKVWLDPFRLACHTVTNAQWLEFMDDGGYRNPLLWLADGWQERTSSGWVSPAYWIEKDEQWLQFGLNGLEPLDPAAPVCHISYYEADAFARWAGRRLPTEIEWEHAVALESELSHNVLDGNFLEERLWRPVMNAPGKHRGLHNMYGNVWEWTQSPFTPYPGFRAVQGTLAEYNGKFMANQMVLRGGSCVTPKLQMRPSYRNFFYPHQRWQFSGLRLADND